MRVKFLLTTARVEEKKYLSNYYLFDFMDIGCLMSNIILELPSRCLIFY